jgi:ketosteroid isomerase-like protein
MSADTQDVAKIRDRAHEFFAALGRGDVSAVVDMLAEDVIILAPNQRIVQGADGAKTLCQNMASRFQGAQSNVVSADIIGGVAARAVGRFRLNPPRADAEPLLFKFLMLWQKVDGAWKISSLAWNRREGDQQRRRQGGGVYAAS